MAQEVPRDVLQKKSVDYSYEDPVMQNNANLQINRKNIGNLPNNLNLQNSDNLQNKVHVQNNGNQEYVNVQNNGTLQKRPQDRLQPPAFDGKQIF